MDSSCYPGMFFLPPLQHFLILPHPWNICWYVTKISFLTASSSDYTNSTFQYDTISSLNVIQYGSIQ